MVESSFFKLTTAPNIDSNPYSAKKKGIPTLTAYKDGEPSR